MNSRSSASLWPPLCLAALALASGGCSLLRAPSTGAKAVVHTLEGTLGIQKSTNTLQLVQAEVMRQADSYVTVMAEGANEFASQAGTEEAHVAAVEWKVHQANSAFSIATGENPYLNAVDFVVLATLSRRVVEGYWVEEKFGKAALPLLEAHRSLETNAWSLVSSVLGSKQQDELRHLIQQWIQEHPHQRYVAAIRLRDTIAVVGTKGFQTKASGADSVLNLLNLDPFGGLSPAVREVARTRVSGERLMFYFQHFPMLLSWQAEALSYHIAAQPAPQKVVTNLASFAQSAHILADTAGQLPEILNRQESQLRELLPQIRQALDAGREMGNSVNGAIHSLDQFVRHVSPPPTNALTPPATERHPFNVAEYGTAAVQVATMSSDIERLLLTATQSAAQLTFLGNQVEARADRAVGRAFRLGLVLVALLLAGSVLAALAYRFLANRLGLTSGRASAEGDA